MTSNSLPSAGQSILLYQIAESPEPLLGGKVGQVLPPDCVEVHYDAEVVVGLEASPEGEIVMAWTASGMRHECSVLLESLEPGKIVVRSRGDEQREFLRVRMHLPLTYELVAPENLPEVRRRVMSAPSSEDSLEIEADRFWHAEDMGNRLDEQLMALARFMSQLDAKLDHLIDLAEGKQTHSATEHEVSLLDISGAGLGFLTSTQMPIGVVLRLRIQFSRFPKKEVVMVGKVARCLALPEETEKGRYEVGMSFEAIHERDREVVFRFISRMERKMLRERREMLTG